MNSPHQKPNIYRIVLTSNVVRGSLTPYHGIVVLNGATEHNPNAVCGLPTTSNGSATRLGYGKWTFARVGGQETTNKTCC